MIQLDGHEIDGIRMAVAGEAGAPRWTTYVTVENADAFSTRAKSLGSEIVVPPTQLGEGGTMAAVAHPTAGTLFAFQYARPFS